MRRIPVLITMVVLMVAMLAIVGSSAQAATTTGTTTTTGTGTTGPVGTTSPITTSATDATGTTPTGTTATTRETTVRYGPFTIPRASSDDMPGMLEQVRLGVTKPCLNCYITSFKPNLVYPNGSEANVINVTDPYTSSVKQSGVMLHHALFTNQFRSDATCGSSGTLWGLAGERFFASGNERTTIGFPAGYGYRVRWWDSWNLLVDLMNHEPLSQSVYLEVTYTYRSASDPVEPLKPVWLDIDNCGDSEYSIPYLYSDTHWDWNVNVPGDVMAAAGHIHGHGIAVEATNESQGGASICRSEAQSDPMNAHLIRSMSTCTADTGPLAHVNLGDTVRLHSEYQSTHPADDVMGIMLAYIHRTT